MTDFEGLLARLSAGRFRYVLVGGYASMVHGASRITQDLDVCAPFTLPNLLRLQNVLSGLHPVHRMTPKRTPLTLTAANAGDFKNLYLDTDLGQLDCLSEISGIGGYAAVRSLSVRVNLSWGSCRILGIDGLIQAKQAMSRRQDREVLQQLRAIRERNQSKR